MNAHEESLTALIHKGSLASSSIFYGDTGSTISDFQKKKIYNTKELSDLESEKSNESDSDIESFVSSKKEKKPLKKQNDNINNHLNSNNDSNFIYLDRYRAHFVKTIFKNEIRHFINDSKVRIQAKYNGVQISSIDAKDLRYQEIKIFLEGLECKVISIHVSSLYGLKFFMVLQELKGCHVLFKCKDYIKGLFDVIFILPKEIPPKEKSECLKIANIVEKHNFYLKQLFFNYEDIRCLNANAKLIEHIEVVNICKLVQKNFELLKEKEELPIFKETEISWYLPKADEEDLIAVNNVLLLFSNANRIHKYLKELENLENVLTKDKHYFSFEIYDCDLTKNNDHFPLLAFKKIKQNENFIFTYTELLTKMCFLIDENKLKSKFLNEYLDSLKEVREKKKCNEKLCSKNDLKENLYVTKIILLKKCFNLDSKKKMKEIEKFYDEHKSKELRIDKTINDWESSSFLFINAINIPFYDAWKFVIELKKKK